MSPSPPEPLGVESLEVAVPWYWSDDIAAMLQAGGRLSADEAAQLISVPIGHRSERDTLEEAARDLMDDGEIPLAA